MASDLNDSATYKALLYKVYLPGLNETIRRSFPMLSLVEDISGDPKKLVGETIYLDVQTGYSSGIRLYGGSSDLNAQVDVPPGGSSRFKRMEIPLYYALGTIDVALQAIKRAYGPGINPSAYPWDKEMKDLKRQFKAIYQRIYHGDATGALAVVSSFSSGSPATFTVDTTRNLQEGMTFDTIRSGSDVTNAVGLTITNIKNGTQFTATCTGTPAADDIITLVDSYGKAAAGMDYLVDDDNTSIQGIDQTGSWYLQAEVHNNHATGGNFVPLKLAQLQEKLKNREAEMDFWLARWSVAEAIAWRLYGQKRFGDMSAGKTELFDSGVLINGKQIKIDQDTKKRTLFGMEYGSIVRGQIGEFCEPMKDPTGGNFIRQKLSSTSATYKTGYEATFQNWSNLAVADWNGLCRLDNIYGIDEGTYGDYGGVS